MITNSRTSRTFKNHFIAGLSSADDQFPMRLWDRLIPQAEITLNLLRQSRVRKPSTGNLISTQRRWHHRDAKL
jgi:hypothetical protein